MFANCNLLSVELIIKRKVTKPVKNKTQNIKFNMRINTSIKMSNATSAALLNILLKSLED
jgi:hypothetical protein